MPTYSRGMISSILLVLKIISYTKGVQATQEAQSHRQKSKQSHSMSLKQVVEEQPLAQEHPYTLRQQLQIGDPKDIQGLCSTLFETSLNGGTRDSKRLRTGTSGNPLITAVHQSGVFDLEILYCICNNAVHRNEQLIQAGLFPSSHKQIETVFTFSVLDDFLADNLECKTAAQQYYSKLQSITNRMFPGNVPV